MSSIEPWLTIGRGLEQSRAIFNDHEYLLYIAHCDGARCGFLLLHHRGVAGSPYIASLAVSAQQRGRGIGARLLEFAEERFRGEAKHLFMCVSSFNTRARALYERHGYAAVGEFKDFTMEGASEILLHKRN